MAASTFIHDAAIQEAIEFLDSNNLYDTLIPSAAPSNPYEPRSIHEQSDANPPQSTSQAPQPTETQSTSKPTQLDETQPTSQPTTQSTTQSITQPARPLDTMITSTPHASDGPSQDPISKTVRLPPVRGSRSPSEPVRPRRKTTRKAPKTSGKPKPP